MNTYTKFCPNVFVAKCEQQHEKGDEIILTTKYGKEHECIVHNYLGKTNDGSHLYSIARSDGFNAQERAKRKAERLNNAAANAEKRGREWQEKANEGRDFLALGEPIKVGHHSEGRHRALIKRNQKRMDNAMAEYKKIDSYESRAQWWEAKAEEVNLSMPESLEYFEFKLEEAKKKHQLLKDKPELRSHSYSLTYAKKEVNNVEKNLKLAVRLWGSSEEIKQVYDEEKQAAEESIKTKKGVKDKINSVGGFFAFNTEQFKEGYAKAVSEGHLEQGDKVTHIKAGLYIPSAKVNEYLETTRRADSLYICSITSNTKQHEKPNHNRARSRIKKKRYVPNN